MSPKSAAKAVTARDPGLAEPLIPGLPGDGGSRELILRESLMLFAKNGFGATTVRDIAAQVGMLSGSLYAHFLSKEAILAQLVHLGHSEHSKVLRAAVLSAPSSPKEQLIALVRAHALFHAEFRVLAIVANAEVHVLRPELARPAMELRSQNLQLFKDILQRGARVGAFRFSDLMLTATVIGSMGARVANWYTPDYHLSAAAMADELAQIACRIAGAK